jgi:hypothetical protein
LTFADVFSPRETTSSPRRILLRELLVLQKDSSLDD